MNDFELLAQLVGELLHQPTKRQYAGALRRLLQSQKPTDETEHLLSSEENAKQLRESIAQLDKMKPTVYLLESDEDVVINAYPESHEDVDEASRYEACLILLHRNGTRDTPSNSLTILRNILERAGVRVVLE